ncbi:hypothetical protein JW835_05460 [bacterium]|nr:hypothetical protein [bacterium]
MAKVIKKSRRNFKKEKLLPFKKMNYILFGYSLLVIIAGYFALAQKPYNSFLSLWIAPILLVLGYVVLIPLSILYNKQDKPDSM